MDIKKKLSNLIRHKEIKELEYDYILDGIYIGTNKCCKTHFEEKLLKEEGIEVDISLEAESMDNPVGVDFYIWIPVINFQAPKIEQLEFGVHAIEHFQQLGKKIYVHCQNGHGRAPTLVAAYIIKDKGVPVEKAIEMIKEKRSDIHLEDIQKQALEAFGDKI